MDLLERTSGKKTNKKAVFLGSLLCAVILLAVALLAQKKMSSKFSPLHVEGTQLVNEKGEPVQLKGLSTHGLQWFPQYVNPDFFKQMHDEWHMNAVRLAMYTAEDGYIDGDRDAFKKLVEDGVNYAEEAGLYAIIDWHVNKDSDPRRYMEESKDFFAYMSEKFADKDHVLYEICNEPNGAAGWDVITEYANEVIPVIRANAPDAVILVGTPGYSKLILAPSYAPLQFDNVMYTLHFYAATNKDSIRKDMKDALEKGVPVFISEFGVSRGGGSGEIDTVEGDKWLDACDELGVSYMMWSVANKDETSAFLKVTTENVSGFTDDQLSDGGLWYVKRMRGDAADEN